MKKEYNPKITDSRVINISFDFPILSWRSGVHTQIMQRDIIKIIRQIRDKKLKEQLSKIIEYIDTQSTYKTDILGQKISKVDNGQREVKTYNHDMRGK